MSDLGNMVDEIAVRWVRGDGRPLPATSYERDGVLYLRRLERADGGRYTCQGQDGAGRTLFQAVK